MAVLEAQIPSANWRLALTEHVVAFLETRAQRRWWDRESVGQLYTRDLTVDAVEIGLATRLPTRWASWSGVRFNPEVALKEREELFTQGWHCIGLWHSHPEERPEPSPTDSVLAADHADAAKINLRGIVFVIVGTALFPRGIYLGVHDGRAFHRAHCIFQGSNANPPTRPSVALNR